MKFSYEGSRHKITFLDVTARVDQGELITDLYWNYTDDHQYLHSVSCHPSHTKSSTISSHTLRLRRTYSKRSNLFAGVKKLQEWFRERGYPINIFEKKIKKTLETPSLGLS